MAQSYSMRETDEMTAFVVCGSCDAKLKVPENSPARTFKCPKCHASVTIKPRGESTEGGDSAPKRPGRETRKPAGKSKEARTVVPVEDLFAECELPPSAVDLVRDQLKDGEGAVWLGQPDIPTMTRRARNFGFTAAGLAALAVLLVGALSCFGLFSAGTPLWAWAIFGVFFVATPAFAFWLTVRLQRQKAEGMLYLLTDQRAIVFTGLMLGKSGVESFYPFELRRVQVLKTAASPVGDLVFRARTPGSTAFAGFQALVEPEKVQDLIAQTLLGDNP